MTTDFAGNTHFYILIGVLLLASVIARRVPVLRTLVSLAVWAGLAGLLYMVVARDAELHQQLVWWANALGLTGSPFDAFLTLRGLRTLDARLRVHQENADAIAELLDGHAVVNQVYFPGLASHPGHALAARQQKGFGAMMSFELDGGEAAVRAFVDGLRYFTLAESLGGVESLIAHPASMTHAAMTAEARAAAGISDGLLRLSIGIESAEDLLIDLRAGLARAEATLTSASRKQVDA